MYVVITAADAIHAVFSFCFVVTDKLDRWQQRSTSACDRKSQQTCQARPAERDRCDYLQDTKLTNAAAWDSLAAGNGNEEEDGQKGAEEEEDNEGGLWNNFQARDDVERAEVCDGGMQTAAL